MTLDEAIEYLKANKTDVPKSLKVPTRDEIAAVEKREGVSFHPDFAKFLENVGGISYGTLELMAIGYDDKELFASAREWGIPKDLIPICEDNADFYCMSKEGEVVFWSHNGTVDEKWESLADWIKKVWIDEG